jgi:uncharacterized membrane protein
VIEVSVEPRQLIAGRATDLGIVVANTGTGRCTNIVIKIEIPYGIRWLEGRERIQMDSLAGGSRVPHNIRLRAELAGNYVISITNFSYVDPRGASRRISDAVLWISVKADTQTPPAGEPRAHVTLDTESLPYDAWSMLDGHVQNTGEQRLSNVAVRISGPLTVARRTPNTTDFRCL